jgi:hypothetical protein
MQSNVWASSGVRGATTSECDLRVSNETHPNRSCGMTDE